MLDLFQNAFPHRRNRDGSHDSICPHCFRTVATRQEETELPSDEQNHKCAEFHLDRFRGSDLPPHSQTH